MIILIQGDQMKRIIKIIIKIILLLLIIATIIYLYSKYINPIGFKVKERTLYSNQLPQNFDGLKVVQISDIHYKTTIKKNDLIKIINQINLTKPDIVFLTGDLLDKSVKYKEKDIETITEQLQRIDTTIDKYYITGDNDNYKNFENIMTNSNFINLNDNYQIIHKDKESILISGYQNNIDSTFEYLNNNKQYSILILHKPDMIKKIDYTKFNLILAGHSLGGQIRLPFIGGLIKKEGSKKYINEHYHLKQTDLYISNGLGNENIEYRTLNKPSFNLFRLRHK